MSELGAGIWSDDDGTMHIDIDAVLIDNGYEPNEQTRAALISAWRQFEQDHGVPVEIIE